MAPDGRAARPVDALADGAGECVEERDHRLLLRCGEMERVELGVAVGIRSAALVVELDDVFQRRQTAVSMYGAVHATSRSVGVLNAPPSSFLPLSRANRIARLQG